MNFSDFELHPTLMANVRAQGFAQPTPIQVQAIPLALTGGNLIGLAQTGTGKTAAFVLPILHRLLVNRKSGTRALIITPTRELAEQINDAIIELGKGSGLRSAAIYGGVGMDPQERALRAGVDIVVACPGRLIDHMGRGNRPPRRRGDPRPRRGRPHARHGLPAGHPPHPGRAAHAPPDNALLGDPARRAEGAGRGHSPRREACADRHRPPGPHDHPRDLPGGASPQDGPAARPAAQGGHRLGADLHPHQAPRQPAGSSRSPARATAPPSCTATSRRTSASWPSTASATGASASWWPPTSPRAVWTSSGSPM